MHRYISCTLYKRDKLDTFDSRSLINAYGSFTQLKLEAEKLRSLGKLLEYSKTILITESLPEYILENFICDQFVGTYPLSDTTMKRS